MRDKTYKLITFPFTPNINWRLYREKYINSKLDGAGFNQALLDRNPVVLVHGKLLENFFSLFYLEGLNQICPGKDFYWKGTAEYDCLREWQGLARNFKLEVDKNACFRFPTPIWLDESENCFFNCNLNYIMRYTYWGRANEEVDRNLTYQILKNFTQSIKPSYFPKFRFLNISTELEKLFNINKFSIKEKYICIFPDKTGHSMHNHSGLKWKERDVFALAGYLKSQDIKTVVFSHKENIFRGANTVVFPPKLEYIFNILPNAKAILSDEIDFTHIGCVVSKAVVFANKPSVEKFRTSTNRSIFGCKNHIFLYNTLTPRQAFESLNEISIVNDGHLQPSRSYKRNI